MSRRRKMMTKCNGGKRRRTMRRGKKGGMCYGRGVGMNAYDPNFSIYNTRELELFPYRPTTK
jgi:hypothetical protein